MKPPNLNSLLAEVRSIEPVRAVGRLSGIGSSSVSVSGLCDVAALGDMVSVRSRGGRSIRGEVITVSPHAVSVLLEELCDGLQMGDQVVLLGQEELSPDYSWLGRIIDPYGRALDSGPILKGPRPYPLRGRPINPAERRALGPRMETGMKVFNTLLPLVRGQRIGLFAGSGIGKSTLLARFALGVEADVVVIALVGERGREVREFVEQVLGEQGMKRAVVVAATSDTSPMARRRCAWAAMTVAEYFRDEGRQVLVLTDSVTRFADAHREIAVAAGEAAGLRGYPASTTQLIASLCERSGPGFGYTGDITAVFSVLVAGSDMDEPIADTVRGVLDGHIVLDRKIAERGRFPAIDVLRSVSRSLPGAATEQENQQIAKARALLGAYDRSEMMIQAGLYSSGSDPEIDAAIQAFPKLDEFIALPEANDVRASFESLKRCIQGT